MPKGYDKNQEKIAALNALGKDLARRSGSKCELCSASKVSLFTHEVSPVPPEPELEKCISICETCREQIENPKKIDADHWRCLNESAWSEISAVKITAVRLLRLLGNQHQWALDLLDDIYLDPEEEEWADKG